jgi:hypothetical protein
MSRKLLELEWSYLSQEAIDKAASLMVHEGIKDVELAVEMAVSILGEERSFELEERS